MGAIIWLASYPKSGNTWTRSFLHNLLRPDNDGSSHSINQMSQLTTWDVAGPWYQPHLSRPIEDCSKEEVAAARLAANASIANQADGFVFVKTHNAMVADRGAPMINPRVTAGAVYLIRNPLDVVVSYSHHLSQSIDQTIDFMNTCGMQTHNRLAQAYEVLGSWSEHVSSWTRKPHPSLFVMRYEDMSQQPARAFGALAQFLRIPATSQQVEAAIKASSFENLKRQEERDGFQEKPSSAKRFFRKGRVGDWQDTLTQEQVRRIVDANAPLMVRFGYLSAADQNRHSAA